MRLLESLFKSLLFDAEACQFAGDLNSVESGDFRKAFSGCPSMMNHTKYQSKGSNFSVFLNFNIQCKS
jgi:hypothetical protein